MYTIRLESDFAFCAFLRFFFRACEPEVVGNDSRVVVAVKYSKQFVVAGDVKRSVGGSNTTSLNGYSTTHCIRV